ncbi:MAG: hypothetical protein ACC641_05585 [Acidiferrobacterales bacterium]
MDMAIFEFIDYRTLLIMGGFLGLLLLFLVGHKKQQQRVKSGKEVARGRGTIENNLIEINLPFHITGSGKWCRVSADFEFASKEKEGFAIPEKRVLHRFELNLRDSAGRTLVDDAQTFHNFLGFSWSRTREFSYIAGGRSSGRHHAAGLPLLEFVPPHSGQFSVTFEMPVEEIINDGGFQYESRFTQFALSVKEDVLPMKARAYPHKKINLRRTVNRTDRK